jgi:hypothetical protein
VNGLAKAQLGDAVSGDKKAWFCSEFVSDAFVEGRTSADPGATGLD